MPDFLTELFDKKFLIEVGARIAVVLIIILLTIITTKILKKIMSRKENFTRIDSTQYKFLTHFIKGLIYFFGTILAIYSVPALRGLATSIFAGSGVLALIIGFASQQAIGNIVAGIFIAMFKPIRIGDRVKFVDKDFIGFVEDITLRHTVIQTYDNKRVIIPNSVLSKEILENSNIVDAKILKYFDMNISFDSNIDRAIEILKEEAMKHRFFFDKRSDEDRAEGVDPVTVRVIGFGEYSVNLRAYIWTENPRHAFILGCDLNKSVKERFDLEGIEMPFPYRTIVYKEPKKVMDTPTDSIIS